jgi:CRISPR-associated protein Cas5t
MIKEFLQVEMEGWTATPRMPFVLSGNAVCLPVPTYSILLGIIGCCLGRLVEQEEVQIGFQYRYENTANDLETRKRLEFDGRKVRTHSKGSDAYPREFHILPKLTLWINRSDWEDYFKYPVGTPALGRSQDLLKIVAVRKINAQAISCGTVSGTMIPFMSSAKVSGQIVQVAESFRENDIIGSGRIATNSRIFIAIPFDNILPLLIRNLYQTQDVNSKQFYLHDWQ